MCPVVQQTGLGLLYLGERCGIPRMGGGEAELGLVMLAYTVISFFLLRLFCILEPDDSDDCLEPSCERRWICNEYTLAEIWVLPGVLGH